MDKETYTKLLEFIKNKPRHVTQTFQINSDQFTEDHLDRTLIWGYDVDRNSHHVYLKDRKVYLAIYKLHDAPKVTCDFNDLSDLIPNKRIYPEASDYDFCWYLQNHNLDLTFLPFDDSRSQKQFYGKIN